MKCRFGPRQRPRRTLTYVALTVGARETRCVPVPSGAAVVFVLFSINYSRSTAAMWCVSVPSGAAGYFNVVIVAPRDAGADVHCQWPRSAAGERADSHLRHGARTFSRFRSPKPNFRGKQASFNSGSLQSLQKSRSLRSLQVPPGPGGTAHVGAWVPCYR